MWFVRIRGRIGRAVASGAAKGLQAKKKVAREQGVSRATPSDRAVARPLKAVYQ